MNTFDFFDTLAVRRVARAEELAALMELTLDWPGFAACRAKAEAQARAQHAPRPPTLAQIYACLGDEARRDAAWAEELRLERELLVAVPANVRRLQGGDLIVADTHHSSAFMAELARACGLRRVPAMQLSCERGASKRDGSLWRALLAEGVKPQVHVGSDARADVQEPQRAGIAVLPFADGAFSPWEQAAADAAAEAEARAPWGAFPASPAVTALTATAVAGCARAARLAHLDPAEPAAERRLCDIAGAVLAPVLVAFVDDALDRCAGLNIRQVCFLAPHGQLLHRLAQQRVRTRGLALEVCYVHGSPQAWRSGAAQAYVEQLRAQMGIKSDTPTAWVGLGFEARQHPALQALWAGPAPTPSAAAPGLHGICLGLPEPLPGGPAASVHALSDDTLFQTHQAMLRALLQADEGETLGFEMKKRRAWPVLGPKPDAATLRAVQLQQGAVLAFAREWAALERASRGLLRIHLAVALRPLRRFLTQPARADAEAFERRVLQPESGAPGGSEPQALVRRLAAGAALARGDSWGLWPEGSLALMGGTPLAPLMKLVRRLQGPASGAR